MSTWGIDKADLLRGIGRSITLQLDPVHLLATPRVRGDARTRQKARRDMLELD
jgi:hypothetical protein